MKNTQAKVFFRKLLLVKSIIYAILDAGGTKMDKISYAVKIEPSLAEKVRAFCLERGIKQGFFVEKALRQQLEREETAEDLLDFKNLKSHETDAISFEEYLKKRPV